MFLSVLGNIHAQNKLARTTKIEGVVEIEGQRQRLSNATVILFAKDSVIARSAFSDERGEFLLDGISAGEYQLDVNYLGFGTAWRKVTITENDTLINVGVIFMKGESITLKTVEIVSGGTPMAVRKDTIEFDASSFKTREHEVVEELLRKLPGVQVGRDGTIKVNGIVVKNLSVDGKPFFSDDPTIATINLTADMIDKVQLIDKKSDWSQFAGISDGKQEKTINITIKKSKKNSYLGRVGATLATSDRFAVGGNVNKFNDDQQIALFINGTNINAYRDKGGQSSISTGGHSDVHNWNGTGLYSKDFGRKLKIRGTYSVANSYTEDKENSERQNLLPDTTWYYYRRSYSQIFGDGHVLSVDMEFKPDTLHMLNVGAKFSYGEGSNFKENLYTTLGGKKQPLNSGAVRNEESSITPNFSATALFGRRFKKAGRALSITMEVKYNNSIQQSINKSDNLFVVAGGYTLSDSIDQKSNSKGTTSSMSLLLTYTEPLFKDYYFELTYGYTQDYGIADRSTYDFNPSSKVYDKRNDSLSNSFINRSYMQTTGVKMLAQKAKYEYSLGLNAKFVRLDNSNISEHARIQQHVVNIFPSVGFNFSLESGKQLQFSFLGDARQPTTRQLQPVPDNSNPLYVQLGNPDLKPAFNGSFNIMYSATNATRLRMFSIGINYDLFINKIVNADWFDSLGRQISQPQNIDGSFMVNTLISTNFPVGKRKASINTEISLGYIRDVSFINKSKGELRNFNIAPSLSYHYSHKEVFDIGIDLNANYNIMRYAMQQKDASFLNYAFSLDNSIHLPFEITIGGSLICKFSTGWAPGYGGNVAMLNAYISKTLFKGRRGLVRLHGADLLNNNVGFIRRVEANYIEDVQTTVAQRLFMINFTYFLKKGRR